MDTAGSGARTSHHWAPESYAGPRLSFRGTRNLVVIGDARPANEVRSMHANFDVNVSLRISAGAGGI